MPKAVGNFRKTRIDRRRGERVGRLSKRHVSLPTFERRDQLAPDLLVGHCVSSPSSYIDDDVVLWLRATDKQVPCCRRIERIRLIGHCAGNQSALAIVADPGPTRPPGGDIARLRKLAPALLLPVPPHAHPTPPQPHFKPPT